ncbi:ABC transporter permease [[Clostridium] symbiosum]|uniref:ABC transporter permease n=1 Tax=Clostridium symbiosum TaxID=1512 RepID=UPI001D07299C|nr:ABC transporter permease [[Clostridium] symbiosum]MCB6611031.1 ABC transporter permease [[Clostridium] symbiosum]MCB6931005.1 ABC transporter permease [[Clostridium] symbiosum]
MMNSRMKKFVKSNEFIVLIILFLVMALFSVLNPSFLTVRNMFDLFRTMIVTGIFACGVMMIIINGGIDMSFMAIAICSAYMTIRLAASIGYQGPILVLMLISAVLGMLFGFLNAFLVNKFDIPIFIVTLSVATSIRGIILKFVGNEYVASAEMPPCTIEFSKTYWFNMVDATGSSYGLHFSVFIMLGIMIITHLILNHTIIGRGVYALGGDSSSAQRIGYNLTGIRMFIYGYAGLLAGIAGLIYVSNNRMADPMSFQGEELTVIAAVVMGGTSISGGKGTVLGVFLGLMLTNVINNNLALINVPSYWQKFTFGLLIIFAVLVQSIKAKREART